MYFALAFVILLLSELCYFALARRWSIVDKPNRRSSHTRVTLRGGGIVFPIAVLFHFFFGGFSYPLFVLGLVLIAGVSFWDDVRPLPNKIRLGVHFVALLLVFAQWNLFREYPLFVLPALVVCAGIVNAWNFMDGINGITGGYSLVAVLGLGYLNHAGAEFVDPVFIGGVVLSLLVFNFFNFRTKAVCFAGDVGSVSMALIVVFLLGKLMVQTKDFSSICLLAVYGVDSVLTIAHRLILRENIFQPHRKHLYQLLANEMKWPHVCVSALYLLLQALINLGYVLCLPRGAAVTWTYVGTVLVVLSVVYVVVKRTGKHHDVSSGEAETR